MTSRPDQEWWSAAEIAEADLPDIPGTKRRVNAMADRLNWTCDPERARRRAGRGGGWEFHWSLFPSRAQMRLLASAKRPEPKTETSASRDEMWGFYESLPQKAKDRAAKRLWAIQDAEALELGGLTRDHAIREAARLNGVSPKSIWNWRILIEGVRVDDRLAYLAPRLLNVIEN